jgi:hypothetical protein
LQKIWNKTEIRIKKRKKKSEKGKRPRGTNLAQPRIRPRPINAPRTERVSLSLSPNTDSFGPPGRRLFLL